MRAYQEEERKQLAEQIRQEYLAKKKALDEKYDPQIQELQWKKALELKIIGDELQTKTLEAHLLTV